MVGCFARALYNFCFNKSAHGAGGGIRRISRIDLPRSIANYCSHSDASALHIANALYGLPLAVEGLQRLPVRKGVSRGDRKGARRGVRNI